ncbi:MAG: TatD family hydrolase, partial [Candidatus Woesearchaeota archaeon]
GLDFMNSNAEEQAQQKIVLGKFIELSEKIGKPMIIHSRKAEKEAVEMLESSRVKKAVLHCFCGKKSLVNSAIDLGLYFSIPANIERAENFQANVCRIDISRLLTETDSPLLSPVRGERNEPANVLVTVKKIAELKKMDAEETANNIFFNYQRLFM